MKKKKLRLVENAEVWQDMDGDNDLEKKLNSYLTCQFVLKHEVPADECIREAKIIIDMVREE